MPLYLFILFIVAYFCASLRCRRRRCGCCLVLTLVTLSSGGRRVCLWAVGQWKLRCKRLSGSSGAYRRLSRAEEGRIGEDRGRSGKGGRVANSSSNRRPLERLQVALPFPMDRVSQKVRGSREPFKIDRWWVHKGGYTTWIYLAYLAYDVPEQNYPFTHQYNLMGYWDTSFFCSSHKVCGSFVHVKTTRLCTLSFAPLRKLPFLSVHVPNHYCKQWNICLNVFCLWPCIFVVILTDTNGDINGDTFLNKAIRVDGGSSCSRLPWSMRQNHHKSFGFRKVLAGAGIVQVNSPSPPPCCVGSSFVELKSPLRHHHHHHHKNQHRPHHHSCCCNFGRTSSLLSCSCQSHHFRHPPLHPLHSPTPLVSSTEGSGYKFHLYRGYGISFQLGEMVHKWEPLTEPLTSQRVAIVEQILGLWWS